ncbi:MAG: Nif3-like dinuclear metal center hexameric protein [Bacilli bacterium]|nr:Nif3-like dinuclear metal center hexameric protein [Bacilli bacterium]
MKTNILLNKLAKRFPKKYAKMNHDFVGLMVGKKPEEVHKIVLVLDLDWEIFDKVKEVKPDIVITHHPFIYGPKGKILKYDISKKTLFDALNEEGIVVYSYHTNFDTGRGGMNDALAALLSLKDVYTPEKEIMMRIGYLDKPMEVHDFARYAVKAFNVDYALLVNYGKKMVQKIGIVGGGGSRDYKVALLEECDIYISGDAPHHVRRDVINDKFNYLDMPHEIEHAFMPQMKKILLEIDDSLEVITFDHEKLPEVILK